MTDPTTEPEQTPGDIANHLAREIKRRRLDAGFSQRGLAAATGYTRQYVSMAEWEDANLPSHELIAAIDTAVGAKGDLVAIHAEVKRTRHRSRQRSNPVVAEPQTGSAGLPVLASSELGPDRAFDSGSPTSLMRSHAVSERSISSFAAVTDLLAGQRQSIAPDALIGPIEAHRDAVAALFRAATDDRSKQRAGALLGETSVVASRVWSAIGDRSMALTHCAFARKLADQLQDKTMGGIARIFESNLRSDAATLISSDGDVVIGLRILKEAANVSDFLPPAARARIGAEQAQAYAVLELREECEEALVRAQRAAEDIDENDRAGLFNDWNTTRIQVYVGTCQLLLGQPKRAIAALTEALNTPEGNSPNVDLATRVDLASAYVLSGELEEGCRLLGDTYDALAAMGNHRGLERAQRAIERMAPWHNERPVLAMRERVDSINGY
ncbi:helix-turn-helix transcriptional regulator [Nocardia salmonicida]|uniref:helix-turn-helix transcriptional regulator n=1 Tax=Nocardia salmonicida TaxID=53431 RepID=UPI0007A4440E|nr:helix-turn-helix domain-containing protein [Nocardia salmonicida]